MAGNIHVFRYPPNSRRINKNLVHRTFGDNFGIGDFAFAGLGTRNRILVNDLPADVAEIIDIKFDDGANATGTVQASGAYTAGTTVDLSYSL